MSPLLRGPVLWATEQSFVRRLIERTPPGRAVAGRFVAGATLQDGMRAAAELRAQGIATILDHLGENVASPEQAEEAADAYIRALVCIRETPGVDCCIAIKLTQLGLDQGREICVANLERMLQEASRADPATLVMIDMESCAYVDRTLHVYMELRRRYPALGVALQSCLRRTMGDAGRIAGPAAIVRMTKGAYLEAPEDVYESRRDVSANFARASRVLLEAESTVHVATHDERLVVGACEYLRRAGVPRERCEFQMLYGIRRGLQARLVAEGQPVRVYVPYGTQWYPYLTRRMAERPANMWFFASNLLRVRG